MSESSLTAMACYFFRDRSARVSYLLVKVALAEGDFAVSEKADFPLRFVT